jgi:hypothetical protein
MASIGTMQGDYEVKVSPKRLSVSGRQRAYYFATSVKMFQDYLNEQGESHTKEEVHHLMAGMFLRKSVVDPNTGEVLDDVPRSITTLNTAEMAEYIDKVIVWLAGFNIIVPDPN